jgi:hypothetical protein
MPTGEQERQVATAAAAGDARHVARPDGGAPSAAMPDDATGTPRGTETGVQAADASGQVRADKEVPEPDSLGG